jgi:hypothetical protein
MQMTADVSDIRVQADEPQILNTIDLFLGLATLARSPAITIRQARRRDMPISLSASLPSECCNRNQWNAKPSRASHVATPSPSQDRDAPKDRQQWRLR